MTRRGAVYLALCLTTVLSAAGFYFIGFIHQQRVDRLNFQGGVEVLFKENTSVARMDQIVELTGGVPIVRDIQLHMVVLRFKPSLTLDEAVNLAKSLQQLPEVTSAGPEVNGTAN
jgi:hypothetical protein